MRGTWAQRERIYKMQCAPRLTVSQSTTYEKAGEGPLQHWEEPRRSLLTQLEDS